MAENVVRAGVPSQQTLVFAVAHEIGNHLGAIRLQAHLLDEDLDSRALARTSIEIDGLASRSGPLLALLRPILSPGGTAEMPSGDPPRWSGLLGGLAGQIEDEGTRGVRVEIETPPEARQTAPGVDWLAPLLMALIGSTLDVVSSRGRISMRLESRSREAALIVEDDGAEEDLSAEAPLRGRPLSVSIARQLVGDLGGRVEADRVGNKTRIALFFPHMA